MQKDLEKVLEKRTQLVYLIHENVDDTPEHQEAKFQQIHQEILQFQSLLCELMKTFNKHILAH